MPPNSSFFHSLSTKDVIVERTTAVGTDIESLAMLFDLFHYFFRTRSAIRHEKDDNHPFPFKPFKDSVQRILPVGTHVCVAVAVLYPYNQVTDDCHARTVSGKLLVCGFGITLPSLQGVMSDVNIIRFTFL